MHELNHSLAEFVGDIMCSLSTAALCIVRMKNRRCLVLILWGYLRKSIPNELHLSSQWSARLNPGNIISSNIFSGYSDGFGFWTSKSPDGHYRSGRWQQSTKEETKCRRGVRKLHATEPPTYELIENNNQFSSLLV